MDAFDSSRDIEYLLHFPQEGDYKVTVKFGGEAGSRSHITTLKASMADVLTLLARIDNQATPSMLFDGYSGMLKEVRLDLVSKKVTLIANL